MNDYRVTFIPEGRERTETAHITERTEAAARKAFVKRFGKEAELHDIELAAVNTNATKEQEREALEKIKAMVAELGPDSYLATAFEGVFEDAEQNIEFDAAFSMKARFESAKERFEDMESSFNIAKSDAARLKEQLTAAQEQIEALERRQLPAWLHGAIYDLASGELAAARQRMEQTADTMAQLADVPQDVAFTEAVRRYREAKDRRFSCEQIVAGLEDLTEK